MPTRPKVDTETIGAAASTIEQVEAADADTITLNNSGLVLRLKQVPLWVLQRAAQAIPKPTVPKVYIGDQDRWEENPADPNYEVAMEQWTAQTMEAGVNVILGMGTEPVTIPDGMQRPEDDGWLEEIKFFGVELDSDLPIARYLLWLTCYALADIADFQQALAAAQKRSGLAEEDAAAALETFRNRAQRRADNGTRDQAT